MRSFHEHTGRHAAALAMLTDARTTHPDAQPLHSTGPPPLIQPAGMRRPQNSFTPSGMLLKALLLAGAAPMAGVAARDGRPLDPPPSVLQGFGRLDLSRSLPLVGNAYGPIWNLQVLDWATVTAAGQSHTVSLASTGGPFIACLVWYDYPAAGPAAVTLVNDLDLQVTLTPLRGDPTEYFGNMGVGPDRLNTVERVAVANAPAGAAINVTVTAFSLPAAQLDLTRQQMFALVLLGKFKGTAQSPFNPAVKRPPPPPGTK